MLPERSPLQQNSLAFQDTLRSCRKISVMKVIASPPGMQPWGWPLRKRDFVGILYA